MDAVVLAGGRGKRFSPFTDHNPKALLPLPNGDKLVDPIVRYLLEARIPAIIMACGYLADKVRQHVENRGYPACSVVVQTSEIGTAADGLLSVAEHLKGDFVVVHCDHYFAYNPIPILAAAHAPGNITFLVEKAGEFGSLGYDVRCLYQPESGQVSFLPRLGEEADEMTLVDGCMILPQEIFGLIRSARAALGGKPEMRQVFAYIAEHGLAKMNGVRSVGWYANVNDKKIYKRTWFRILGFVDQKK